MLSFSFVIQVFVVLISDASIQNEWCHEFNYDNTVVEVKWSKQDLQMMTAKTWL